MVKEHHVVACVIHITKYFEKCFVTNVVIVFFKNGINSWNVMICDLALSLVKHWLRGDEYTFVIELVCRRRCYSVWDFMYFFFHSSFHNSVCYPSTINLSDVSGNFIHPLGILCNQYDEENNFNCLLKSVWFIF